MCNRRITIAVLGTALAVAILASIGGELRAQVRPTSIVAIAVADIRTWDTRVDRMLKSGE